MKKILFLYFGIILFVPPSLYSQAAPDFFLNKDSIQQLLQNQISDTSKANVLNRLSGLQSDKGNLDEALNYANEALRISVKSAYQYGSASAHLHLGSIYRSLANYEKSLEHYSLALPFFLENSVGNVAEKKNLANIYNDLGIIYRSKGDFAEAFNYFEKELAIAGQIMDKNFSARALLSIGLTHSMKADYPAAIKFYLSALKLAEATGDKKSMAATLGNIGLLYANLREYSKALDYYSRSQAIYEAMGIKEDIAINLVNIANIRYEERKYTEALADYSKALEISEAINAREIVAHVYGSIGLTYMEQANELKEKNVLAGESRSLYVLAQEAFDMAIKIYEETGNKNGEAEIYGYAGSLYYYTDNFKKAETYLLRCLLLSEETGALQLTRDAERYMSDLYRQTNRNDLALLHYKKFIAARDSITNEENAEKIVKQQMRYEFDKKEALIKQAHIRQAAIAAEESKRQRLFMALAGCVVITVGIIALVVLRSLRITRTQKLLIESQKHLVEEKQKEILDSIHYAKRIQKSLLPTEKYISKKVGGDLEISPGL